MLFRTDPNTPPIEVSDEDVAGAFLASIASAYAAPPYDQYSLEEALIVFLATYRGEATWDLADFKRLEWLITQVELQAARVFGRARRAAPAQA